MGTQPSLKARAIALLAQREQSRVELRRKLLARAGAVETAAAPEAAEDTSAQVDTLLDWLEAQGYLSVQRFVESRVHARAARFGTERIRRELAQHGVSLPPQTRERLQASELARAREVWARKFGSPAADAAGRARQARFLIARGFSSETVRRVVQAGTDD